MWAVTFIRNVIHALVPERYHSKLRATVKRFSYVGLRRECPFCHARLRNFLPFGLKLPVLSEQHVVGGGYRDNALCPVCLSIDRERLVYLYLRERTDLLSRPGRLLHIAPEGALGRVLREHRAAGYVTADLSSPRAMIHMDLVAIPFPDRSFDTVICNHVLEHIPDDRRAMSELYRILKPGGWAILQVPISLALPSTYEDPSIVTPERRAHAFGQDNHVRIYATDYEQRLQQARFVVTVFDWTADPIHFGGRRNRFGLNPDERVFLVTKPGSGLGSCGRSSGDPTRRDDIQTPGSADVREAVHPVPVRGDLRGPGK